MHQIHLMTSGNGIISNPLPINNPTTLPPRRPSFVIITCCPICGLSYVCNNVVFTSCGCTYYLFCLGVYLENKTTICVGRTCGEQLEMDWMTSVGF